MNNNWTTIALIISQFIASLIAPTLAAWLLAKSRINQPTPTPEPNQQNNRPRRIKGWFIRVPKSWQVPSLCILFNIYQLIKMLRETGPITRGLVLGISLAVGGILYWVLLIVIGITWQMIERGIADSSAVHRLLCDWLTELNNTVEGTSAATRETQDKVLVAIKNLFRN